MAKTKKQIKVEQANSQSDNMELAGWGEGLLTAGVTETKSIDSFDTSYSVDFGDLGQLDLFAEEDLREKYPALKQAHEHYQSILEVCKTKEKEDEDAV
jgi:hypothetical protein|tara:strand:+ start:8012 stop:8305 length:294 start_codon:yes stop_codon:yes gene_type:complete